MKVSEFVRPLKGVKETSNGYVGPCPAHPDRHPSLVMTDTDDRILIHCRAGCRTSDVLSAMGLDYRDLFFDNGKANTTTSATSPRQPERVPLFYWDWRSQCAELEQLIQAKREHAEAMLQATHGLEGNALTVSEFDEVMGYVGRAYDWLERCERLDETLFMVQQTMRAEEHAKRVKTKKVKVAA